MWADIASSNIPVYASYLATALTQASHEDLIRTDPRRCGRDGADRRRRRRRPQRRRRNAPRSRARHGDDVINGHVDEIGR